MEFEGIPAGTKLKARRRLKKPVERESYLLLLPILLLRARSGKRR